MKKKILAILAVLLCAQVFSGCQAIGDIFKTGVGVGIFIVATIIIVIIAITRRKK